jgi:hypothetical protein
MKRTFFQSVKNLAPEGYFDKVGSKSISLKAGEDINKGELLILKRGKVFKIKDPSSKQISKMAKEYLEAYTKKIIDNFNTSVKRTVKPDNFYYKGKKNWLPDNVAKAIN